MSGIVGPHTWTFIVKDVPQSDEDDTRATIVGHARWAVTNANQIHYSQGRSGWRRSTSRGPCR